MSEHQPVKVEKDAPVAATGRVEPITCTYNGSDRYGDPASPWVFRDDVDRYGPVLECDVHGLPAQWPVYESSDTGPWSGACHFYEPTETRVVPPAEPGCSCGHPSDDHVFTGGGFCNVCECQRYVIPPADGGTDE